MKTIKHILNCFAIIIIVESCSDDQNTANNFSEKTPSLYWVTGHYYLKGAYGNYFENWEKGDSVTYYGLGYFMDADNEDTLFRQRMKLHQTPKGIFMFYDVKNQNDNKIVEFKLTKQENKVFTFENAFRDYPSLVTYKILSDTTINVVMTGFKDGKEKKEDFVITK